MSPVPSRPAPRPIPASRSSEDGSRQTRLHPRRPTRGALLAVALLTTGCGLFSPSERRKARVRVGADPPASVRVVTSIRFRATEPPGSGGDPDSVVVELLAADTLRDPGLPLDRTFDISETGRFFVEVTALDTATRRATLEVFIDGEQRSDQEENLQEGPLRFVFLVAGR